MKNLTRLAAFLGGAVLASLSLQAQTTPNDLYLGFQNQAGGGTADYIINLGSVSSFTSLYGSGSVLNLSSDFSLANFDSAGLSGTNSGAGIMGGVLGGSNGGSPSDLFLTQLRTGGAGNPSDPGSIQPGATGRSEDNEGYAALSSINGPAVGSGILDTGLTWQNHIEPANAANTFIGVTGINPDSSVSSSTVLYEDLWSTSNSSLTGTQPWVYEGYITLDLTGSSPDLTFTPAPEPSSYLISGAGGMLVLLLRNRLRRRNA